MTGTGTRTGPGPGTGPGTGIGPGPEMFSDLDVASKLPGLHCPFQNLILGPINKNKCCFTNLTVAGADKSDKML